MAAPDGVHAEASAPSVTVPDAGTRFRRAMGRVPTGVAVITSVLDAEPLGMTVGTLTYASADPPILAFFAQRASATAGAIELSGRFGASLLGRGQEDECYRFATSRGKRFDGLETDVFPSGAPRIRGAVLWADCTITSVVDAGDHRGFLGLVESYEVAPDHPQPLTSYRSRLAALTPGAGRHTPTESFAWW